jgi:hypothetical protein
MASAHQSGETLAGTRTRLDANALKLTADMLYEDVWADTTKTGITARAPISIKYAGNTNPADNLQTTAPVNGVINYPDHIQPLWSLNRGAGKTCTGCHDGSTTKLDLGAQTGGSGRMNSYDGLMLGDPVIDATTGLPVTRIEEGALVIVRGAALVDTAASEGEAFGLARKSRLAEILFGEHMLSGAEAQTAHPTPTALDHSTLLNAAEKRLIAEWMDTGGKYYNDPFDANSKVRQVKALSQETFEASIEPILNKSCGAFCHQAVGSTATGTPPGTSFRNNRFVLTGDAEGDYNVTLTMISDACTPSANYLLSKPSTVPHPPGAVGQTTAVLPVSSANYNTIFNWIKGGC